MSVQKVVINRGSLAEAENILEALRNKQILNYSYIQEGSKSQYFQFLSISTKM